MKISIVSCYFINNYGSLLQAFALQEYLRTNDHTVENLNVSGIAKELDAKKIRYYLRETKDFSIVLNKLGKVRQAVWRRISPDYAELITQREKHLSQFRENRILLSELFLSKAEMTEYVKASDAVVIGSDQLWLPSNIAADYYTLNFVPDEINKVAYSTSFGIPVLPEKFYDVTRNFLQRIQHLSVREATGVEIVNRLGIADCELVCDPTMLLTRQQWLDLIPAREAYQEPYILCYFLGTKKEHRVFAKKVGEITGYKIVSLFNCEQYVPKDKKYADEMPCDVGVEEFVNLIRNAQYVLTDSFHGTVFSILNHKQFFNFTRHSDNETLSTNSRIYNLMDILGITNRVNVVQKQVETYIQNPVDYRSVDEKLEIFRNKSRAFLDSSLSILTAEE